MWPGRVGRAKGRKLSQEALASHRLLSWVERAEFLAPSAGEGSSAEGPAEWLGAEGPVDGSRIDLVVAQAQHLQSPEAQKAPRDGLQLVVVQQQLSQGGVQAQE